MNNLKLNKKRIKALFGAIILSTNLTACSFSQENKGSAKEMYVTEDSVLDTNNAQYLVVVENGVERIVPITSLKLVNSKNEIVSKVDGVIVNGKIMDIQNPVEIKFSLDVEKVIINNELLPVSEFSLVNGETLEKLTNIVGMYANYEYIDLSENSLFNDNRLTDEKFYSLVDEITKKYIDEFNLDVTKEDVIDYLMLVNIDKLSTDNNELITTIIGERNPDDVVLNAFNVYSAILTENNDRYCAKELGFDSIITVSETVFDENEKDVVESIEKRIKEIVLAKSDKDEFNKLLNNLLTDMLDAEKDEFNMKSGAGYSTMTILINFVRINFLTELDKNNAELIKYFVTFAGDGVEYEENSRTTAYYRDVYSLLTDCPSYTKVRNK